jgi:hypothetical protein
MPSLARRRTTRVFCQHVERYRGGAFRAGRSDPATWKFEHRDCRLLAMGIASATARPLYVRLDATAQAIALPCDASLTFLLEKTPPSETEYKN